MKAFLALILLFSLSYSLDYSTLEMEVLDQDGDPAQGVNFFIRCKMTFTTVDRFLCKSGLNGTCSSGCVECASGEPAFVRAEHGNQSIEQEIPSWKGSNAESCKSHYPTSNTLGTFIVWMKKLPKDETAGEGGEGAEGNLPENVNIETKEHKFELEEEDYEYVSYVDYDEEEEEPCLPAFALIGLFFLYYSKYSLN